MVCSAALVLREERNGTMEANEMNDPAAYQRAEIVALEAERNALRLALREIADAWALDHRTHESTSARLREVQGIARAALGKVGA